MADSSITIRGLSRFRSTLKRAGADMADMKSANLAAANIVRREADTTSPRRSGRLAASVRPARQVARARVYSTLIYAPVIEYGWPARHITANPFLSRAAEQTQDEWLEAYERDLEAILAGIQGV